MEKKTGYIDIHSHIIPKADDGAKNTEESLELLKTAAENGIRHIIATPHNKAGYRYISAERIRESVKILQKAADGQQIPVTLYSGMEILYREEILDELENGKICTLAESRYILLEFLPQESYTVICNAVDNVIGYGYIPILAHVERYEDLLGNMDRISHVTELGALLQVNAGTITGSLGWKKKRIVKKMLQAGLIHFVATDTHDLKKRTPELEKCASLLYRKYGEAYADALLWKNAGKIIENRV